MRASALTVVALLAACGTQNSPTTPAFDPSEEEIGRYQMVIGGPENEDIFLLDTESGTLRKCWFAVSDSTKVSCGDPHSPV